MEIAEAFIIILMIGVIIVLFNNFSIEGLILSSIILYIVYISVFNNERKIMGGGPIDHLEDLKEPEELEINFIKEEDLNNPVKEKQYKKAKQSHKKTKHTTTKKAPNKTPNKKNK